MTYRPEPATTGPRRWRTLRALLAVSAVGAEPAGVVVTLSTTAGAAALAPAAKRHLGPPGRRTPTTRPTARPRPGRTAGPPSSPAPAKPLPAKPLPAKPLTAKPLITRPLTTKPHGAGHSVGITVSHDSTKARPTATGAAG